MATLTDLAFSISNFALLDLLALRVGQQRNEPSLFLTLVSLVKSRTSSRPDWLRDRWPLPVWDRVHKQIKFQAKLPGGKKLTCF